MIETTRTATHEFYIEPASEQYFGPGTWRATYRSLNPRTGLPWQAPKHVTIGATVGQIGFPTNVRAYSTLDAVRAAVVAQKAKLAR